MLDAMTVSQAHAEQEDDQEVVAEEDASWR